MSCLELIALQVSVVFILSIQLSFCGIELLFKTDDSLRDSGSVCGEFRLFLLLAITLCFDWLPDKGEDR